MSIFLVTRLLLISVLQTSSRLAGIGFQWDDSLLNKGLNASSLLHTTLGMAYNIFYEINIVYEYESNEIHHNRLGINVSILRW